MALLQIGKGRVDPRQALEILHDGITPGLAVGHHLAKFVRNICLS